MGRCCAGAAAIAGCVPLTSSTMVFWSTILPPRRVALGGNGRQSGKMGAMDAAGNTPRVLVVDDDDDVLASLERGLRLFQFEVSTAKDGAEALRSAAEKLGRASCRDRGASAEAQGGW